MELRFVRLNDVQIWTFDGFRERRTVCVSCGGWERGLAVETGTAQIQKTLKKRGAYPPSSARFVGRRLKGYTMGDQWIPPQSVEMLDQVSIIF